MILRLSALLIFFMTSSFAQANAMGKVSAYWIWGSDISLEARMAKSLYVYQGNFNVAQGRNTYHFEGPSPRRMSGYKGNLILTYRLERLVPPAMVVSRYVAHRQAWKRYGIPVEGIQIDFDSPTAKLREYASWLVQLNNILGESVPVSITGLGDWLASAPPGHLKELSQQVSFVAFMMYHGSRPLRHLKKYTARLENLSLPFKLGRLQTQIESMDFENVFQAPGYQGEIVFMLSGDPR